MALPNFFLKKICVDPAPRSKVCFPKTSAVFLTHVSACVYLKVLRMNLLKGRKKHVSNYATSMTSSKSVWRG